jgi:hypothetical protein
VTTDRRCLLQQLAFSELRHFSWDMLPANTMAYDMDMLHWAMRFVLHRCTAMSIEMAGGRSALLPITDFVIDNNRS